MFVFDYLNEKNECKNEMKRFFSLFSVILLLNLNLDHERLYNVDLLCFRGSYRLINT